MAPPMPNGKGRQQGYTYLLMLFVVMAMGYSLALLGERWHSSARREQALELDFVLDAYAQALASYRRATPDGLSYRPQRLQELIEDSRSGVRRRHLRRILPDPTSGKADWIIVRDELGIVGVCAQGQAGRCSSDAVP